MAQLRSWRKLIVMSMLPCALPYSESASAAGATGHENAETYDALHRANSSGVRISAYRTCSKISLILRTPFYPWLPDAASQTNTRDGKSPYAAYSVEFRVSLIVARRALAAAIEARVPSTERSKSPAHGFTIDVHLRAICSAVSADWSLYKLVEL